MAGKRLSEEQRNLIIKLRKDDPNKPIGDICRIVGTTNPTVHRVLEEAGMDFKAPHGGARRGRKPKDDGQSHSMIDDMGIADDVISLYSNGETSLAVIGEKFGVHPSTVRVFLSRRGLLSSAKEVSKDAKEEVVNEKSELKVSDSKVSDTKVSSTEVSTEEVSNVDGVERDKDDNKSKLILSFSGFTNDVLAIKGNITYEEVKNGRLRSIDCEELAVSLQFMSSVRDIRETAIRHIIASKDSEKKLSSRASKLSIATKILEDSGYTKILNNIKETEKNYKVKKLSSFDPEAIKVLEECNRFIDLVVNAFVKELSVVGAVEAYDTDDVDEDGLESLDAFDDSLDDSEPSDEDILKAEKEESSPSSNKVISSGKTKSDSKEVKKTNKVTRSKSGSADDYADDVISAMTRISSSAFSSVTNSYVDSIRTGGEKASNSVRQRPKAVAPANKSNVLADDKKEYADETYGRGNYHKMSREEIKAAFYASMRK